MQTDKEITEKQLYTRPTIVEVKFDNEISLQLESFPPEGPDESKLLTPYYFNNDPFKTNQA